MRERTKYWAMEIDKTINNPIVRGLCRTDINLYPYNIGIKYITKVRARPGIPIDKAVDR